MKVREQSGFSLLELMAVILVIGMGLAMVSMTMRGGEAKDEVWDAVEQFMLMAQFASERAILSGESSALYLEPPEWQVQRGQDPDDIGWRYRWLTSSSEGWQPLPNFPPVTLPPGIRLMVEIEDYRWDYESQVDRTTPVAAYYPSGEVTPIRIELTHVREPGFVQTIEVDENGQLVWLEAPEPPEEKRNGF
jgi:general secretion pathway protein H